MQFTGILGWFLRRLDQARSVIRQQPAPERFSAFTTIVIAAWFAVLTGLGELVILAIGQVFLHRYIYYFGPHLIWMAPAADLIIFLAPAILFLLLGLRWRFFSNPYLLLFSFSFLSYLSILLIIAELNQWAAAFLAIGLAVQTARFIGSHWGFFNTLLQRTMGWARLFTRSGVQATSANTGAGHADPEPVSRREFLTSVGTTLAALTLVGNGWDKVVEKLALAELPDGAPDAPNVLMIVLDTVRAQNLSLYGYSRPTTPQLERVAKNGVVFNRAVASASWTLPSHASLFTGRHPHETRVNYNKGLDGTYPTLAKELSGRGYETAGFVSNIWYCSRESGLNRGFTNYQDFPQSLGMIINSSSLGRIVSTNEELRRATGYYEELGRKSAPEINRELLNWLGKRDPQRPFFAFVNYFDAHEPYLPPEPFDTMFGPKIKRVNPRHNVGWDWSSEQLQAEMDAYDGAIAYLDQNIGLLMDELEQRGVLKNTLVIIAGDHGEEFREHNVIDHGYSLYWLSLHVPLLLSFPQRLPTGRTVRLPVGLRDIPATVMDILGFQDGSPFPGMSLKRYWDGSSGEADVEEAHLSEIFALPGYPTWYPATKGDMQSLVIGRFHYIKGGDGKEELYDVEADPFEKNDLAKTAANADQLGKYRDILAKMMVETEIG